nr:hypothetical protein [Tanacetum cinerariifolium]
MTSSSAAENLILRDVGVDEEPQPASEPQVKDDEYNLQRGIQMSLKSFQAPIDGVAIHEPASGITQRLLVVEGKGKCIATDEQATQSLLELQKPKKKSEDVSHTMALKERIVELEEGRAGSDTHNTLESRPPSDEDHAGSNPGQSHVALAGPNPKPMHKDFIATIYPKVHESLKHTSKEHVFLENPPSSSRTLSSMKNLDDAFTYGDQFLNDKPTEEEPGKANVETKVKSMVTVPIHQASSSVPLLSTLVIDLTPSKPISSLVQEPIFTGTTATTTTTTTTTTTLLSPPPPQQQSIIGPELATPWKTFDTKEAPSRSSKQKTAAQSEQPADDVSIPDDVRISDAEDTGAAQHPKIKTRPDWSKHVPEEERPKTPKSDWVVPPNDLLETENNWANAIANAYKDPEENKLIRKTRDMGSFIKWNALSISKLKAAYYPDFRLEELVPSLWIESEREYDISAAYGISHWWFKRKEFNITRHIVPSNRRAVRSHLKILNVVSLKTFSRYGYTYLKEIILRIADYKEYKISEAGFKNLHPNDFEDLYLLHLQGNLNHLSGVDKVHLFNAVKLWIRNIVIRKRVEDLQLRIECYQTKLNLTQPS